MGIQLALEGEKYMRLKDEVAIITGGGSGIGKAISMAFAAEGAIVILAARNFSRLEETVETIKSRGGRAKARQTNVSDEEQVQQLVAEVINDYGRVDILVNNSGIGGPTVNVVDLQLQDWNEVLAVNLTGSMLCAREVLKHMIPRRKGNIVNMGSDGGRFGYPMRSPYCVSKWGIVGLTETLAIEVGQHNIRVNCLSPAAVKGERLINVVTGRSKATGVPFEELMNKITEDYSLQRPTEETEVAAAAVFLASDESSGITGHTLVVNCGHHIVQ
jgi:NAD(P)-dependent dehydrogenase (short-subunit alcohol dehydrogenase family)